MIEIKDIKFESKEFVYSNEKVICGRNCDDGSIINAEYKVNSKFLYNPRILSEISMLIGFYFKMRISPEIAFIEFDGQCIINSINHHIKYILKAHKNEINDYTESIVIINGIRYASIIAKKYKIGIPSEEILKNLRLIN